MVKTVGKKRRLTWWMIALGLVVLGAGYLMFRQIEMRLQKAEFKRAEAYVEQVAAELKGSVRTSPDATSQPRSCSYAARKFAKGPRSCRVSYEMVFKDQPLDNSNSLLKEISGYAKSRLVGSTGEASFTDKPMTQRLEQTLTSGNLRGMACNILYQYGVSGDFLETSTRHRAIDLVVSVNCYGEALAEYYPIAT